MDQAMPAPGRHLTPEDIEYALSLLSEEQKPKSRWTAIFQWLVLAIVMITGLIGIYGWLVTIWFNRALAWRFFFIGIGVLALFFVGLFVWGFTIGLLKRDSEDFDIYSRSAEESVKDSEVGRAAKELWDKRSDRRLTIIGLLIFAAIPGCVWMTYVLIRYQELSIPALFVLCAPLLAMAVLLAIEMHQEDQYYRTVVGVRGWLEQNPEGEMSPEDFAVLTEKEDRLVKQSIQQVSLEMSETKWYSVVNSRGVQEYLGNLGKDLQHVRYNFRDITDELQFNPIPADAEGIANLADTYTLQRGSCRIIYKVDNSAKRVTIIDLQTVETGEADNGS